MKAVNQTSTEQILAVARAASEPRDPQAPGRVGLIGPTRAGKTTYFAVLDRALRDLDWRVEVQNVAADDPAQSFLINNIRRFINRGYFPKKTPDQIPDQGLYFRISKNNLVFELNFFDPPGEIFEPSEDAYKWETQRVVFDSIQTAKGILILMDLDKTPHQMMNIWHYSIESFLAHVRRNKDIGGIIQNDRLSIRTAVVFTKADNLPWMARHRSRNAEAWLEGNEGLKALAHDIRRDCSDVRFYFSSAVGWNKGRPNCRTIIRPVDMFLSPSRNGGAEKNSSIGELVPDPAGSQRRDDSPQRTHPLFRDPLRITDHALDSILSGGLPGVITLPGRNRPEKEEERFLTPWNIVEPLLWAAGFDHV